MFTTRSIVTSFANTNGGSAMKSLLTAMFLLMSLSLAACGSENTLNTDGTLPVSVDPSVTYVGTMCIDNGDCSDLRQICALDIRATDAAGYEISACVKGCDVEFKVVETKNVDGTWSKEQVKVSDTCQRNGKQDFYCDPEAFECVKGTAPVAPPVVTPPVVEPPVVEPTLPQFVSVSCCFNAANLTNGTYYAQLAWSTSDATNPEAFGKDGDLSLDSHGCFLSTQKVERSKVFMGYWVELTNGKAQDGNWLGAGTDDAYAPISCEVDSVDVNIGSHMNQCGFGLSDAANADGTSANCQE